ncbi:MMPL family transporter OS=Streptomyces rimosus subsp. rimosus (strain ATCC / DSM 40260 / JCM 4667 / NRRL 2234) OX=1265868 GN=SRIM_029005 PE=4 SV=1 [Streptomyces rimosus subsp. rimosus]
MQLLGGANWWLPGWLERRLPRISIEPPEAEAEGGPEHGTAPDPGRTEPGVPVAVPLAVPGARRGDGKLVRR